MFFYTFEAHLGFKKKQTNLHKLLHLYYLLIFTACTFPFVFILFILVIFKKNKMYIESQVLYIWSLVLFLSVV